MSAPVLRLEDVWKSFGERMWEVALANRTYPDHGASVRISWPRQRVDMALRNPVVSGV